MMRQLYQITEYGSFISGRDLDGFITLPEQTFAGLENFILCNRKSDTDALELMGISVKKGVGKVITAKNYVGVITLKDGTSIEILPKLYSSKGCDAAQAKRVLIEMLKTLRSAPYKSLQTSNVDIERMNVFEIFVRMFINEVFSIVKHGLKCDYRQVEENSAVFKGKLVVSAHIRHNCVHKERSYVAFDEFDPNRPENRLLKSSISIPFQRLILNWIVWTVSFTLKIIASYRKVMYNGQNCFFEGDVHCAALRPL